MIVDILADYLTAFLYLNLTELLCANLELNDFLCDFCGVNITISGKYRHMVYN